MTNSVYIYIYAAMEIPTGESTRGRAPPGETNPGETRELTHFTHQTITMLSFG